MATLARRRLHRNIVWTAAFLLGSLGLFAQRADATTIPLGIPYTVSYSDISPARNGSGTAWGLSGQWLGDGDVSETNGFVGVYGTWEAIKAPGIITFKFTGGVYNINEFDLYNNVVFDGGGGVTSYELKFYDSNDIQLGNTIVVGDVSIGEPGTADTIIQSQLKLLNRPCVAKAVLIVNSGDFGPPGRPLANPIEIREAVFKGEACTSVAPTNPCCPPFNNNILGEMLYYQGTGTTTSPYKIIVVPSYSFRMIIQKYIDFLHSMTPATRDIVFAWSIRDQGTGVKPIGYPTWPQIPKNGCPNVYSPVVADSNGATQYFNSWTATGVVGVGTVGGDGFTTNGPIAQFSATTLQPDHWYTIWAGAYLNNPVEYFSTANCGKNCVTVRWQTGKPAPEIAVFENGQAKMVPLGPPPIRVLWGKGGG